MNIMELQQLNIDSYKIGANYCMHLHTKNLTFVNIEYCKDKHFEICAVKLKLGSKRFCIITIYRVPTGNIDIFLTTRYSEICIVHHKHI
jgi:hypothetical protein